MSTVKFSKLLFTETLPVRRGNFYLDQAAADEPPDNLLRNNYKYGTEESSLFGSKPRGKKEVLQFINVVSSLYS